MEVRKLTCIECPMGCSIEVTELKGKGLVITGNSCARGKIYAENEVICPKRVITSTVKVNDGRVVSVKTDGPVPKSLTFNIMNRINAIELERCPKIGEIVLENVIEGINVVATDDLED